ncbi:MAG TPA: cation-transporting P-type ATPase [Solirubrobacterales bacterium]|nr:cation-transporting P-type ATPase [Solirubrobacterales bacterium]
MQPAPHSVPAAELAAALRVDPEVGLSSEEAARRLEGYGPNRLPEAPPPSRLATAWRQLRAPMVGLLVVAAAVSFSIGEELDAAVIGVIVIVNACIGYGQERGAERAMASLRRLIRDTARVLRDGRIVELEVGQIVPGDVLAIGTGDQLPADGRLLGADDLEVDESPLTGESLPVAKRGEPPAPAEAPLADRPSAVFAGSTVVRGTGRCVVTATGAETEAGLIARAAAEVRRGRTPLETRLDRLASLVLRAAVIACVALAALAYAQGEGLSESVLIGVSLAVAAVPEGLPAVVTIVLAIGVRRMADRGAIVRRLPGVETLGSVTVVCTDKTGTLTAGTMEVERVQPGRGFADRTGAQEERRVIAAALLASDPELAAGGEGAAADATEAAIARIATARGIGPDDALAGARVAAVHPFDSERKRMSVAVEAPGGIRRAFVKGAPEAVIDRLSDAREREALSGLATAWADEGLRVLLVAERELADGSDTETDLMAVGLIGIGDPIRPEAAPSMAEARTAGVRTVMITGDHPGTAVAVAKAVGLADEDRRPGLLTGLELDRLSEKQLAEKLHEIDVYARVAPVHKVRIVDALRRRGEIVAMTGDGVNDVPALRAGHAGIAMGRRGTDAARENADIVLGDDNYATIVAAIRAGRTLYENVVRFVHFLLAANAGEILVFAAAIALGLSAPLTVLQILMVNLLTDGLPAVALGLDPADPRVMSRPPRPPREDLIDPIRSRLIVGSLAVGSAAFAAFVIGGAPGTDGQTMAFLTLVFAQLAHVFAVRGMEPFYRAGRNPSLIGSVLLSAALMIVILAVGPVADRFSVTSLSVGQFVAVGLLSLIPFASVEAFKAIRRRRPPTREATA